MYAIASRSESPRFAAGDHFLDHRQQLRDVIARGELGHDAAERRVDRGLAREPLGKDPAAFLEDCDAGLVAARFDPEYPHRALQAAPGAANMPLLCRPSRPIFLWSASHNGP